MKKNLKKTKTIASVALAAVMASSVMSMPVSADIWSTGYNNPYSYSAAGTASATHKIPQQIYMTQYSSNNSVRRMKAEAVIGAAEGLLSTVDSSTLGLPPISFNQIMLSFGTTKYDYLIRANAENNATVLTFNSSSSLNSAMAKIKAEEQNLMNAALAPYVSYLNTLISNGSYTNVTNIDSNEVKAAKLSNAAILGAVKNMLNYTYVDSDLFSGDVTGNAKTYQIGYLSTATVGNSITQSVVANDEEFTNFPRLIINGQVVGWDSIHHLSLFGNSNDSWWFALKDGNTLNNDYYWLEGMMIPDFTTSISFDAYAYTYWAQYGDAVSNSNNSNNPFAPDSNGSVDEYGFYYNAKYDYKSDYVYTITSANSTFYYPNNEYAKAAVAATSGSYISNVSRAYNTDYALYFCFVDGRYYSSVNESPYPNYTKYMNSSSASAAQNGYYISNSNVYDANNRLVGSLTERGYSTQAAWFCTTNGYFYSSPQTGLSGYYIQSSSSAAMNYYVSNGYVYDSTGKPVGTVQARGYSTQATWFSTSDGLFYSGAQSGKNGYFLSSSATNPYGVDMSDPYYQYWTMKLYELTNNKNTGTSANSGVSNTSTSNTSASKPQTITVSDDNSSCVVTGTQLAAARASDDTITVNALKSTTWTVKGADVTTAKDISFRTIFSVKNIPDALKNAVRKDAAATLSFTVGENISWGARASVEIRLNAKRANFIAKLYHYDTAKGMLVLINTSTVDNNGCLTFNNLSHGGDYYIVLN